MMRQRFATALFAACLLGLARPDAAAAQGTTTGSIRGQVVSQAGEEVAGARVSAVETSTGLRRAAATGGDGRYTIPLLPSGRYRVEVNALGYSSQARADVAVRVGES